MCPVTHHNSGMVTNKIQHISLDLLAMLVDEADRWPSVETVWAFHFGEPLLHPYYTDCLEMLHKSAVIRQAQVIQHTNGSLLKGDKARAILEIPVIKKLVFSFDGFGDRSSYEVLRGPHFENTLENIRQFAEDARRVRPELMLSTCTIVPRQGEVPGLDVPSRHEVLTRLHGLFDPMGVEVVVRDMHAYCGADELEIRGHPAKQVFGGCSFVEEDSLYMTVNGWAQPCCAVYSETFRVGRFPDQSFGELLNGKEMRTIRHALRMDLRAILDFCSGCSLSMGGIMEGEVLRAYWKARDAQGGMLEVAERRHLFEAGCLADQPVRVDLGCGGAKPGGFIGIDRYPLNGVDIVADLDKALPLADDSVDLVLASHSLEHVGDLLKTMEEIHRVCRHGAQVCIVAPYHQQHLNLANPYHRQVFNEHTPRFWTSSRWARVNVAEFAHPHAEGWGLGESDHSRPAMDLRCLRMELFYFPEYRRLGMEERRRSRLSHLNVCDQIMYHLVVVKERTSEAEMEEIADRVEYFEPPYVTIRRLRERCEQLEMACADKLMEAKRLLESVQFPVEEAPRLRGSLVELEQLQGDLDSHLVRKVSEWKRLEDRVRATEAELASMGERTVEVESRCERCVAQLSRVEGKALSLADELRMFRDRKLTVWFNRFFDRTDLRAAIAPAFRQLLDDSYIFGGSLKRFRLQPSIDLGLTPFVSYHLDTGGRRLQGIMLAVLPDMPAKGGLIGIEIVSSTNSILMQQTLALEDVDEASPARFSFPLLPGSEQTGCALRVFVRDAEWPVRILEWRRYRAFGLGPLKTRPFCGFDLGQAP